MKHGCDQKEVAETAFRQLTVRLYTCTCLSVRSDKLRDIYILPCVEISMFAIYTLCLKKVPTFELSVTSKVLHCWKAYEICYKTHSTLPILPWACCYTTLEINNSNFLQIFSRYRAEMQTNCILITSNFVIHPQILIFSVIKIASFHHWLQIKF